MAGGLEHKHFSVLNICYQSFLLFQSFDFRECKWEEHAKCHYILTKPVLSCLIINWICLVISGFSSFRKHSRISSIPCRLTMQPTINKHVMLAVSKSPLFQGCFTFGAHVKARPSEWNIAVKQYPTLFYKTYFTRLLDDVFTKFAFLSTILKARPNESNDVKHVL